jgi:hypothetical protein
MVDAFYEDLAPHISHLSCLRELHIGELSHGIGVEAMKVLTPCLATMPALEYLIFFANSATARYVQAMLPGIFCISLPQLMCEAHVMRAKSVSCVLLQKT